MSPFQITILEVIKANDGKLSWYQLDRALTHRAGGPDPAVVSKDLMPALHELEEAGYIATNAGHNPGQPLYSMNPKGLHRLDVGRDETGTRDDAGPGEMEARSGTATGSTAVPA